MNKKTVVGTSVFVFLLFSMVVTSALAQPRIVGVNIGDWFVYGDIAFDWSSNDPNATFPFGQEVWEYSELEWLRLSVEDISNTNVTFQSTFHFTNGSEVPRSDRLDVDTGEGNMTFYAISAGLGAGDTIYSSGIGSAMKINETVTRTYPDTVRDTNHFNMTSEQSQAGSDIYAKQNLYWDKLSGILVEQLVLWRNQTGDYLTTWFFSQSITESNIWVVPEFPTWTSILLVLITLTVTIAIYKRRLLKTPTPTH